VEAAEAVDDEEAGGEGSVKELEVDWTVRVEWEALDAVFSAFSVAPFC